MSHGPIIPPHPLPPVAAAVAAAGGGTVVTVVVVVVVVVTVVTVAPDGCGTSGDPSATGVTPGPGTGGRSYLRLSWTLDEGLGGRVTKITPELVVVTGIAAGGAAAAAVPGAVAVGRKTPAHGTHREWDPA